MHRTIRVVFAAMMTLVLAACGGATSDEGEPSGAVPESTVPVYLATALGCSLIEGQEARFTPLRIEGEGYATTVEPVEDCIEQTIFSSYFYEAPVTDSGEVTITPGNQPSVTLGVADLVADGGATVVYARPYVSG